ncbi:hypothetical protein [Iodidimonas gelatinilytica]|uniref:hypothetical protein n=1 Tax=Iodidimonas gelatinilytica TaxID=1236966 RepID=UPI001230A3FC|nr:hypothetical protein [Iodidimonas gelatinilytica]
MQKWFGGVLRVLGTLIALVVVVFVFIFFLAAEKSAFLAFLASGLIVICLFLLLIWDASFRIARDTAAARRSFENMEKGVEWIGRILDQKGNDQK